MRRSLGNGEVGLAARHFVMQAERPLTLTDVEISTLDPFLRSLLFTDGTVTRALAVQTLTSVIVEVVDQVRIPTPPQAADCLEVEVGSESIQRRVAINAGAPARPMIWAESHIVEERLPAEFIAVLDRNPGGIGESSQQVRLEGWRELLWFGLDSPPEWVDATDAVHGVLQRAYRVVTEERPGLLISESFPIELRDDGIYHLAGAT